MRGRCFEQILRLGYSFFGALGVIGLFAAVVSSDWIRMQEPFEYEETMTDGYMATAGPGGEMGGMPPGPDGGPMDPGYPGGAVPEDLPEGMEDYPYDDEYGGTMSPLGLDNPLFFIKAHSGLWHIWYNLYMLDHDTYELNAAMPEEQSITIDYFSQAWTGRPQGGKDTIFSIARGTRKSTFPLLLSLALTLCALVVGTLGNVRVRQSRLTMVGAILCIVSSLLIMLSAMLFMLAVNDEVGHRPKPKNTDEHMHFLYRYSWGFAFIVSAYINCSLAAVINIYLFQRGFHHKVQQLIDDGDEYERPSLLKLLKGHKVSIPGATDRARLQHTPIVVE